MDTSNLTKGELLAIAHEATIRANAAQQRLKAWGTVALAIKQLREAYEIGDTLPDWIIELFTKMNGAMGDRRDKLAQICGEEREKAQTFIELYEMRGQNEA